MGPGPEDSLLRGSADLSLLCVSMPVKKTCLSPGEAGQGRAPLQDGGVSDPPLAKPAECAGVMQAHLAV